jgi:imidazolonepropionase-like amidohydrolase
MKPISALLVILAIAALGTSERLPGGSTSPLVITDVTVIDATGSPPQPDRTVVIVKGQIASIQPAAQSTKPAHAQVVDGHGLYMIPGLWDMHAHAFADASAYLLPLFYFQLSLANGVTGLRDMAGFADNIEADEQWRSALQAGSVLGPELLMAGSLVDGPHPTYPRSVTVGTPAEAKRAVDSLIARRVDFIKVYNMLPREEYLALAAEARARGIPFAGHVPLAVPAGEAADVGQASFEHLWGLLLGCSSREQELRSKMLAEANRPGTRPTQLRPHNLFARELADSYDPHKAAALFAKLVQDHTWQVPTLSVLHMLAYIEELRAENDPRLRFFSRELQQEWNPARDWRLNQRDAKEIANSRLLFEQDLKLVRAMHAAGIKMLAGTDSTEPYTFPGFTLHDELAWLVRAGLSPMEALQSATRSPAEFLHRSDRLGTVQVGKNADLVLLTANPIEDIHNTRKIAAVILHGKYLPRPDLDHMLNGVAAAAEHN